MAFSCILTHDIKWFLIRKVSVETYYILMIKTIMDPNLFWNLMLNFLLANHSFANDLESTQKIRLFVTIFKEKNTSQARQCRIYPSLTLSTSENLQFSAQL